jgi:cyclic dehypoxanthinyl futalosine synthase
VPTNLNNLYQKIRDGKRIAQKEAQTLFEEGDFLTLGRLANDSARKKNGNVVGYVIDRNINYTNVCALSCQFCNFYRKKKDEDSYTLSFDEIDRKIEETIAMGGTGILMQGGHHPDYKIEWYEALFQHIHQKFPKLDIHALSPPEIKHIANISRVPIDEALQRLKDAGLMSIPGGGGEILVDRVRKQISAGKVSADDWITIMTTAHKIGLPSSATMMFGHVETIEERFIHLERMRRAQDETGGFFAFIPWNFQANDTELGKSQNMRAVSSQEYLKMLALARIFLDNFKNIQVSWLTQGLKVAAVALHFGANDIGSCMIEENVISQAGAHHAASGEDLRRTIVKAGLKARQRNSCYKTIMPRAAHAA